MKKRLAVIGANAPITMLIEKAKALGYETHVFAWACGAPGESAADFFYPISVGEKEAILEKCREIGICGVCSVTSDFAVPTVNYVARGLGLVGNSERTDVVARNKFEMRRALQEAGLYVPSFMLAGPSFRVSDAAGMEFPLIVKPTDRWSSKGVTRVDRPEELEAAVRYAVEQSYDGQAVIEGFMEGPEYSAECICYRGEVTVLALTKKMTTGFPHYVETGHSQPSDIPAARQPEVVAFIKRAVAALSIRDSAAHAEFRLLPDGRIGIIEIGARMGGDSIGTDLTPISTGMDYLRMVIDVAVGNPPCFDIVTPPVPCRDKFILTPEDLAECEALQRSAPERLVRVHIDDTDFGREVVDSNTRHGYFIVRES